jgi:amidase
MASGGDGGGSIRIPASCCGLFGFKPTRGRTPTGPKLYEAWEGLAVEHALTRTVRDSAALLDATAGLDVGAPYAAPPAEGPYAEEVRRNPGALRIAFTSKPLFGAAVQPHADCLEGLHKTAHLLETLGHQVEEAAPTVDGEELAVAFVTMLAGQLANDIAESAAQVGRKAKRADFELSNWVLGMIGRAISGADYVRAVRTLQYAARRTGAFFAQYDVLLTPTLAEPPVLVGSLQPTLAEQRMLRTVSVLHAGKLITALNMIKPVALKTFAFIPYTPLFNATGQPAMSVPLHWTAQGLPIGMHFVGRFGDEATLFRLAGQLEQACPWSDRVPSLLA